MLLYIQGGDGLARKQFTTTIEEEIQKQFKEKCSQTDDKMNDVLEAFMESYIKGEFEVQKEVKFSITKSKK